jgi:hypothetical protein
LNIFSCELLRPRSQKNLFLNLGVEFNSKDGLETKERGRADYNNRVGD